MAEQIFGWSPEEVMGQFLPLASGRSEEVIHSVIDRTLRGEMILGVEMKQWRKVQLSLEHDSAATSKNR